MLKVLNITEEGRFAGPNKRICEVAVRLRTHHNIETVALFSRFKSDRFQKVLKENDIPFHAISMHRLTKDLKHLLGYFIFFFPEVWRIYRILKKENPDLVHCNGSYQIKGIIASSLAVVPNIWHMNDTYMPNYIRALFKVIFRLFSSKLFIFASKRARQFYFPGNEADELKSYALIPAPVDASLFSPNQDNIMPFNDYFEGTRVITVGHINVNKNHALFIRMAHAFQQQYPDIKVRFYIAGAIFNSQKTLYRSLCKLIKKLNVDNVIFLGERRDIKELLNFADIYVCSSAYEASPISVWEALAMAKPVLSTDVGDVAKLFEKYHCGIVEDKNNSEEMARLVGELVQNEEKRIEMGDNARRAAIEELDLPICAEKHARYYKKVTN